MSKVSFGLRWSDCFEICLEDDKPGEFVSLDWFRVCSKVQLQIFLFFFTIYVQLWTLSVQYIILQYSILLSVIYFFYYYYHSSASGSYL